MINMRAKAGSVQSTSAGTALIIVPSAVALDTAFPFRPHDKVMVRIDGERVIVEKLSAEQKVKR
jgi:hypothetical protein